MGQGEEGKAELVSQEVKMLQDLGAEQREESKATPTPFIPFNSFCLFSALGMGSEAGKQRERYRSQAAAGCAHSAEEAAEIYSRGDTTPQAGALLCAT